MKALIADDDLSGKLVNAQLCTWPAYWLAVQACAAGRQPSGPEEHQDDLVDYQAETRSHRREEKYAILGPLLLKDWAL
jgi:hypothetical protein